MHSVKLTGKIRGNASLKAVLSWFALLSFLLHVAVTLHLYERTHFESAPLLEIYLGSEATLALIPDYPDHFRSARTLHGILKLHVLHLFAIPLFVFVLLHLLSGILAQKPAWLKYLMNLYVAASLFVLLAPLGFFADAWIGVYFYFFSFWLFVGAGCLLSTLLAWGLFVINRKDVMI